MRKTTEIPGVPAKILVMRMRGASFPPTDEQVIECATARRAAIRRDIGRMTDVFMASVTEANEDLVGMYGMGLSSLRRRLGDAALLTDRDKVESMIDAVHRRFLNEDRGSILSRFNEVFIEHGREPVDISDDRWLAARRHCLAYDTTGTVDMFMMLLSPGKQRENLLAQFMNATLNKGDGVKAVTESIARFGSGSDTAQAVGIRQCMANFNRQKAVRAYANLAREAQQAAIEKDGILLPVWSAFEVHETSGLAVETSRINGGNVNHTPQTGALPGKLTLP